MRVRERLQRGHTVAARGAASAPARGPALAARPLDLQQSMLQLQRQYGNRYVQRLVESARRSPATPASGLVQRYQVPGALACGNLVRWLNTSSPYAPEWAENKVTYAFQPAQFVDVQYKNLADGQVQGTATGKPKTVVKMTPPTDLPEWDPDKRPNRGAELQAWQAMLAGLRAHENEHVRIGTVWRGKIEANARAVKLTATGSDRADAEAKLIGLLQAEGAKWEADAQAEQDQFDTDSDHGRKAYKNLPVATLTCPVANP